MFTGERDVQYDEQTVDPDSVSDTQDVVIPVDNHSPDDLSNAVNKIPALVDGGDDNSDVDCSFDSLSKSSCVESAPVSSDVIDGPAG